MIKLKDLLTEFNKGSFLDNKILPKLNQNVWILSGQFGDIPLQGIIKNISNIDKKGLSNTYVDVQTKKGIKHVNIDQIFDHKPIKTKIKDKFGVTSKWM